MKHALWMFLAALTLSACANPAQEKLQGRWIGDSITNVDVAQLPAAIGWVRGASFEFAGSHITVAIPTELPQTADYEVVQGDDSEAVVAVHRPDGAVDTARFSFDSERQMRWHIGDGRDVIMRRMD